jgi:hypothetical protein
MVSGITTASYFGAVADRTHPSARVGRACTPDASDAALAPQQPATVALSASPEPAQAQRSMPARDEIALMPLPCLRPGMQVVGNVLDAAGQIVVPSGKRLDAAVIQLLLAYGVSGQAAVIDGTGA